VRILPYLLFKYPAYTAMCYDADIVQMINAHFPLIFAYVEKTKTEKDRMKFYEYFTYSLRILVVLCEEGCIHWTACNVVSAYASCQCRLHRFVYRSPCVCYCVVQDPRGLTDCLHHAGIEEDAKEMHDRRRGTLFGRNYNAAAGTPETGGEKRTPQKQSEQYVSFVRALAMRPTN
jgi:hypothetical protein